MPLRERGNASRNPWTWVAILLLLAVAAIGFGSAHHSGALAQPAALLKDLLKKKGVPKAKIEPGKKQLTTIPGKGVIPGTKGVLPGATPTPKNILSKGTDGNVGVPKAPNSVLPKGTDSKNATGPLPKGIDPKGTATS